MKTADWTVPEDDKTKFAFLITERKVGPQQSYQLGRNTNFVGLYCDESVEVRGWKASYRLSSSLTEVHFEPWLLNKPNHGGS